MLLVVCVVHCVLFVGYCLLFDVCLLFVVCRGLFAVVRLLLCVAC